MKRRNPTSAARGGADRRGGGWLLAAARDERGVALVLTLIVLMSLTGLVLALLSVAAFEPQISRNLADTTQARHVADAGVELAFNTLAATGDWSTALAGATCAEGALVGAANQTLPGLSAASGTYTLRVRNDCQAGDEKITGVAQESAANATVDTNGYVIVTATATASLTGSTNAAGPDPWATRAVTVALRKVSVPTFDAALAFPGVQADVDFSGSSFRIDGRDTRLSNAPGAPTGTAPAVYGISVSAAYPGNATAIEDAASNNQENRIRGRDQTSTSTPPGVTTGVRTIAADGALTSQAVTDFVNALKQSADISLTSPSSSPYTIANMGASCAGDPESATCWGTTSRPKVVYVKGEPASAGTQFNALAISGSSTGTGILIVEDGNVDIRGSFRWNGPIIVTGRNVGLRWRSGGTKSVYGAVIVHELNPDGSSNLEGNIAGAVNILYSREALDLATSDLGRRLITVGSTWREN
jgi:Tfp pilus assembly protein PilX